METKTLDLYYKYVVDLIIDNHTHEFEKAQPGHCMKITGLGEEQQLLLWDKITSLFPNIDTFILSDEILDSKFISATKLIEYRNQQENPLLVLIPSNSRTAAEDSYGNATFKEISLDRIETQLSSNLFKQIPEQNRKHIDQIFRYIGNLTDKQKISYLLVLEEEGYSNGNIGKHLNYLGLLPDLKLLEAEKQINYRLKLNLEGTRSLSSFNKSIYDIVNELKIKKDTLQKNFVQLFKSENNIVSLNDLLHVIKNKYSELWFDKWDIPNLNFEEIKLEVLQIRSKKLSTDADGRKVLVSDGAGSDSLIVRFKTTPEPKDLEDLKYFRIILMAVDGYAGQEIKMLRKLKNTTSTRTYREATVELTNMEDGAYFIKVLAEDENGVVLNDNDDYYDDNIQEEWKVSDYNKDKRADLPFKLKSDSEDFDFFFDKNAEKEEVGRKAKLNNVLQAFFKFNIDGIKENANIIAPAPSDISNIWLNDDKPKQSSVFHVNYSDKHNYQIILSTKLRQIENLILDNGHQLGYVFAKVSGNSTTVNLDAKEYIPNDLTLAASKGFLKARQEVFEGIKNSNESENGVFETVNLYLLRDSIKKYLRLYERWLGSLKKEIKNSRDEEDRKHVYSQIQFLDIVKIRTTLPNGENVTAILLSPLHPLRLSWFINLIELFEDWYNQTQKYAGHQESWRKLEELFIGNDRLNPTNNPFVIVDPERLTNYDYLGELCYGWGIYLNSTGFNKEDSLAPIVHQIKYYFRNILNIDSKNIVSSDVSGNLIKRQIENFLVQHPYTNSLILNLFNVGDASAFADAFIKLSKNRDLSETRFEVRIFTGDEVLIEHGEALKDLLNPDKIVSEEAEMFSQPSKNRLFPKLRFSLNNIDDFLKTPSAYNAHISFLVNPFSAKTNLYKPFKTYRANYLNSLLLEADTDLEEDENKKRITWNTYINIDERNPNQLDKLYDIFQSFTAGSLAARTTDSVPATTLTLSDRDQVLLSHLHTHSDWVITFDKNMGPQFFDQPSDTEDIPFLLDYIPGEEISDISSYLTTKPSAEILGLLGPHFEPFGLNYGLKKDQQTIKEILEDLRSVSSSLVLQLNSTENRAFEVIGMAFSKRVLVKKGLLKEAFLIPIDLHKNLFEEAASRSKSRADCLFVSINVESRTVNMAVLEIKCRTSLNETERSELKEQVRAQIENTIEVIKYHFDPQMHLSFDRLDRDIKNKELYKLFHFYIERAFRYNYLGVNAYNTYIDFIQTLSKGFEIKFSQLGFIFDFSFNRKHLKEKIDDETTIFTFGRELITEILDSESDLNTHRLEKDADLNNELKKAFKTDNPLREFAQSFKTRLVDEENNLSVSEEIGLSSIEYPLTDISEINTELIEEKESEGKTTLSTSKIALSVDNSINQLKEKPDDVIINELDFDIMIGTNKTSEQYGILGKSIHDKIIALDLSETNTISLFGVQGGGKSYTIGTITEMVLKQFANINELPAPLAGVIFHYSESMDYEPEFTSMVYDNDNLSELDKLEKIYNAKPGKIEDVIILTPEDKVDDRQKEFPSIQIEPISFNSKELNVQDWLFLLGAVGNDSSYIKQLKFMMKAQRKNITIEGLKESVEASILLSNTQKALANQKLLFAQEYINDDFYLKELLKPGRLIIVDLRDEFIVKDDALGLFVIMLNIFAGVKTFGDQQFNKFIVFDEAHKYMDNKDLTNNIVTAIREMRHKGVSIMIASQDPPSLPVEIIELSSIVLLHKFNSPQWLRHVQRSLIQLESLNASDMSILKPGEAFLWSSKATDHSITTRPVKISTRPRVTKHGGETIKTIRNQ